MAKGVPGGTFDALSTGTYFVTSGKAQTFFARTIITKKIIKNILGLFFILRICNCVNNFFNYPDNRQYPHDSGSKYKNLCCIDTDH
jgi:hypothetical protein